MLKNLKSTKNIIKSEAGVSLIEVLVAFGILAIIATGVASLMTGGMKQQKGMQAKDQQREITAEIRSLLGDKAACLNSFGGGNPAGPACFLVRRGYTLSV